jgi:NAD(P)-dependent dehydrogenase (short-subunit alcohol dehydrogenase family)
VRAIVVGASKGIGRAIYHQLGRDGQAVWGLSRTSSPPLDLTHTEGEISHAINKAVDALGGLDLLVLSAGMGAMHTPFEESGDNARALMQANFFGPIAVWRACSRELLKSHGTAIFIGSTCADRPSPGLTLYRSSKAALHAFVLNQAHTYRGKIRVHVLAPGWVDTEMTADLRPAIRERIMSRIPAGRFATVEEVAAAFFMLLDNKEASIYQPHEDYNFTTELAHGR